jgi:hypothetical protein
MSSRRHEDSHSSRSGGGDHRDKDRSKGSSSTSSGSSRNRRSRSRSPPSSSNTSKARNGAHSNDGPSNAVQSMSIEGGSLFQPSLPLLLMILRVPSTLFIRWVDAVGGWVDGMDGWMDGRAECL